jgi:hypothetical protein
MCGFLIIWLNMEVVDNRSETNLFPVPVYGVVSMLAIFTLVTGLMHIVGYASPDRNYQDSVDRGLNWKRWFEYTITATLMLVIIAMSSGVRDGATLGLIAVCAAVCMICGHMAEVTARSQPRVSKWSTVCGWLLLGVAYGVIMQQFYVTISQSDNGPPKWVQGVVWSMLGLFTSFGIIHLVHMVRQWSAQGSTVRFNRKVDAAYTVTSTVAKSTLVIMLASGLFARTRDPTPAPAIDG